MRYLRTLICVVALLALTAITPIAGATVVPDPHTRSAKTKRMYACNQRPATWSRAELECVVRIGFGVEADNAMRIVACESVWNPRAVSATSDYGLFQINRRYNAEGWRKGANIFDPVWNTRIALYFYRTRGWHDWTCAGIVGV